MMESDASDTDPDVQRTLDRLFAALPLEERATRYFRLWDANRALLYEGIKMRHPKASPEELDVRFKEFLKSTWDREG
jgi:hypothetical protein